MELKITRNINEKEIEIALTETEIEEAYRIMQREYLKEDITNESIDRYKEENTSFYLKHIEKIPELLDWLCYMFEQFDSTELSHNSTMDLVFDQLEQDSKTSEFFSTLSNYAKKERNLNSIRQNRADRFSQLAILIELHNKQYCSCKEENIPCSAIKYLQGEWDISKFFNSVRDKVSKKEV